MKRVVTLQDISSFGRCSITVALPILSAMGMECAILPTAVLSAHTMFPGYTCLDISGQMKPVSRHWQALGLRFDAIYTGYLANEEQCEQAVDFIKDFRTGENIVVADPAMADQGRLYPGFGPDFPQAMAKVCACADLILPNLTEAALLTGTPWQEKWTRQQVRAMLEKLLALGCKAAMITGFGEGGDTGFLALDRDGRELSYSHPLLPRSYPGTGDVFSSVLVGGLVRGLSLREAGVLASDFVAGCIAATAADPQGPNYGVEFEGQLGDLMKKISV